MVSYSDFQKLDLRVAEITAAEKIKGSSKLLKLKINIGSREDSSQKRQLVAGIGNVYKSEDLIGLQIIIVANLEPKTIMDTVSQGMLLAVDDETGPVLIVPSKKVKAGSKIT